jgi:hypothetical protein
MIRHFLLWLIAIVSILLFAPLLNERGEYEAGVDRERASMNAWYGDGESAAIVRRANRLYDSMMVRTGIDPLIREHFVQSPTQGSGPELSLPESMGRYARHMMDYAGNFLFNLWLFLFRLAHSWTWIVYLSPFLVAVIFDGVMTRKAKLAAFQYTSPTIYNVSWHLIIAVAACSFLAFAMVIPLPVFFYPAMITAIGVFVRLLISNIQHSA